VQMIDMVGITEPTDFKGVGLFQQRKFLQRKTSRNFFFKKKKLARLHSGDR
jgi:hypothetical protein